MKKLFPVLAFLFSFQALNAQTTKWDSTYRPNIYTARAGQFKTFPKSKKDIIFLGNSITAYGNWDELLGTKRAKNRGIPGDLTFGVLARLDDVIQGKPSKIFILIGTNDIARGIPDSIIVRNFGRMIQRIKLGSPKTEIYIHTLLPVNNTFKPSLSHFDKDEHFIWVNAELKKLAAREGVQIIDLYTAFLDADKRLVKDYAYDGLHLNDKGYLKWAEILKSGNYLR